MSSSGPCQYCFQNGALIVSSEENNDGEEMFICDGCAFLLKDKETAVRLLRGHLAMVLRGQMTQKKFDEIADKFFEKLIEVGSKAEHTH
jgi:uncharacterized C2H2 Zn-finger protein